MALSAQFLTASDQAGQIIAGRMGLQVHSAAEQASAANQTGYAGPMGLGFMNRWRAHGHDWAATQTYSRFMRDWWIDNDDGHRPIRVKLSALPGGGGGGGGGGGAGGSGTTQLWTYTRWKRNDRAGRHFRYDSNIILSAYRTGGLAPNSALRSTQLVLEVAGGNDTLHTAQLVLEVAGQWTNDGWAWSEGPEYWDWSELL